MTLFHAVHTLPGVRPLCEKLNAEIEGDYSGLKAVACYSLPFANMLLFSYRVNLISLSMKRLWHVPEFGTDRWRESVNPQVFKITSDTIDNCRCYLEGLAIQGIAAMFFILFPAGFLVSAVLTINFAFSLIEFSIDGWVGLGFSSEGYLTASFAPETP